MMMPIEVTGGPGGSVFLMIGTAKTCLYDAGMAYCAPAMLEKLESALDGRRLDYLLISHSHYDHIAAIPYLRQKYSQLQVLGSAHAHAVLRRSGALRTMRSLSLEAAVHYGAGGVIPPYDDALMRVDSVIGEGDTLDLGDITIRTLETPGHTNCCLTFVAGEEYIFPSETTCYKSRSGAIYPAFLTGCADAVTSVYRCARQRIPFVMSPHYGLVTDAAPAEYWQACLDSMLCVRDAIVAWSQEGMDEDAILQAYEGRFRDDRIRAEQPSTAFVINTRAMIRTALREHAEGIRSPYEGQPLL